MRMETSMQMRQTMKLSPQIIQSIEILQLPLMALINYVEQELEENPVLEETTSSSEDQQQTTEEDNADSTSQMERDVNEEFEKLDRLSEDWNDYFSQTSGWQRVSNNGSDQKREAIENTACKPISLQEYLINQLSLMKIPESLEELCENIIYNIDKNGYLQSPLEERIESLEDKESLDQAGKALCLVQSLEPPGVGARDLKECLLLQLDSRDKYYGLATELISNYLGDIEPRKYQAIAKKTGHNLNTIKEVISLISALDPRPGSLFDDEVVPYIRPEIKVECVDGRYEVSLLDNNLPNLRINSFYGDVLNKKDSDPETYGYVQKKISAAKWLIEAIEQRRSTLYKISAKIVELQQGFLDEGIRHLRTLKMQDVADAVDVHVSTVSRAISNKYIQTPQGVFDMKFFFTGGFKNCDGTMEPWEAMRHKLAEIIANEDKKKPLSDDRIAKKLNGCGLDIARRTITKYRKIMRIPSSRQRKVY